MSGSDICPKRSYTDLGIIISDDFSWRDYYQKCCQNAYASLSLIRKVDIDSLSVRKKAVLFSCSKSTILLFASMDSSFAQ